MSEIKYVIEVDDSQVEKVFDDIEKKAIEVAENFTDSNKAVSDSVADIVDSYNELTNESVKAIEEASKATTELSEANDNLSDSFTKANDSAKQYAFTNQEIVDSSGKYFDEAQRLSDSLSKVNDAQNKAAESNKNLSDSYEVVADKATVAEKIQSEILKSVGTEYEKSLSSVLKIYNELPASLQDAYQKVSNLEGANKRLTLQQANLNKALKDGNINQLAYLKGTAALNAQRDKTNKYLSDAKKNLDDLLAADRAEITSVAEKTAKLTQLKKKWDELTEAQRKNVNVGGKISKEYQNLNKEIERANSELTGVQKGTGQLLGTIGKIGSALGIAFGVQQLVSFGLEIFDIAKKVEGVSLAFSKLGQGEQGLQKLREATGGTVDDLKLMALAVDASNLKIPLDTLAKGLEFAGRRAQDTGKSVDYLVESFVTGLGRKSTQMLDNLGLSIIEIQEEVKKVGNFNIAVGNIIDREMSRAGDAVDTLGNKTSRLATIWENAKIKIATAVAGMFGELDQSRIDKIIGSATEGMKAFEKASNNAQKEIISNRGKEIESIEKTIKKSEELRNLLADPSTRDAAFKENGKNIAQLLVEEKSLKEQLVARRSILENLKSSNKEMDKQERLRKGIVSDAELEEKITKLRQEANQWIVKDNSDQEYKNKLLKEAEKLEKQLASRNGKGDSEAQKKALAERKKITEQIERDEEKRVSLLEKYASLNSSYVTLQLENDKQEIQSVKDKYAALRKELEKYNKGTKGRLIELDKLESDERIAVAVIAQKQAYAVELKGLEDRSKLWAEYEDLKTKIGEEKAKQRYDAMLKDGISYERDLQDAIANIQSKPIQTGQDLEQIKKYEDLLKALSDAKRKKENSDYVEALELVKGYNDKLIDIEKKYNETIVALGEKASEEQLANAKKWKEEMISNLSMDELIKSDEWYKVFGNILDQTKTQAQESIKTLKDSLDQMLKDGDITLIEYDQAIKRIKDVDIKISTSGRGLDNLKAAIKLFNEAKGMAKEDAFAALGQAIDSEVQKVMSLGREINGIFDQLGIGSDKMREDLSMSLDALSSASSATAKFMAGDWIGGTVDAIASLSKVINIFSKDRKLERSIQAKADAVRKLDEAFNNLGRAIDNSVGESFYKDSKDQIKNLEEQKKLTQSMMADEQKKKKTDQNKVNEYKKQLTLIDDQIHDINKSITEMLVQTSFKALSDNLADALVSAFNAGEDGIKSMNKVFDNFIKNAITNSLKLKMIEPIVNELIDKVSTYMLGNNNSLANFNFDQWRDRFGKVGEEFNNQLKSLYDGLGLEIDKAGKEESGLQGAIRREMTEATAGELTGLVRSQYDMNKRKIDFDQQQGMKYISLMQDSLRGINAIQHNTLITAERLLQTNESLLLIVNNTNALNEKYA